MVLFPNFLFGEGKKMVMGRDFDTAKLLCSVDESQHGSDLPSPSRGFHCQAREQEEVKQGRFQMGETGSRVGWEWEWDTWDGNGSRVEHVRVGWDQEKLCGSGSGRDREGAGDSRMGVGGIGWDGNGIGWGQSGMGSGGVSRDQGWHWGEIGWDQG